MVSASLSLALALSLVAPAVNAAEVTKGSIDTAIMTARYHEDVDTCNKRESEVDVFDRTSKVDGAPTTTQGVTVWTNAYNECTGEFAFFYGTKALDAGELTRKGLDTATLDATLSICDNQTFACTPAHVTLTWTGSGDTFRTTDGYKFWQDGAYTKFKETALTRSAVDVQGSILSAGRDWAVGLQDVEFFSFSNSEQLIIK